MQQIGRNVYAETGYSGCNVGFVITSEGVVLIDSPQRPSDAVTWREEIQARGPMRYLINTEHHGDHTTGNFYFPTTVVSHERTGEVFVSSLGPIDQLKARVNTMDPDGLILMEGYAPRPPSITYSERMTLRVGNQSFKLINLPGHTPNETVVYIPEEKVVFTGDNIFYRTHPFFQEAVPFQWLESLKVLEGLDVDTVVPGHGEVCDKSGVLEMVDAVEYAIEAVRKAMKAGMSKEEAARSLSFAERFPINPSTLPMMGYLQAMNVTRIYEALEERG